MAEFHKTVIEFLEPTLGKLTARKAIELVASRQGKKPEQLRPGDIDKVCDGLRPMLRTLLGAATTQQLLGDLRTRAGAPGP
ncbi:MAG: hypothetical protein H6711_16025 [Myxococcales bacterium]|nr:hypothetical protein [Myxococcales bacterium]